MRKFVSDLNRIDRINITSKYTSRAVISHHTSHVSILINFLKTQFP